MELSVLAISVHEQAVADFKVSEQFAYNFIMKVKRIRDERLFKELGFTSFDEYCENSWKVIRRYMDERIQIADSFGQGNFESTYSQIGHSKSLLLARLEPESRQQIESTVDVNDVTVKELNQRIKQMEYAKQETERLAAQAQATAETERNSARHFEKLWTQAKSQPPRVETKTVHVVPDEIKKELRDKDTVIENLKFKSESLEKRLESAENLKKMYEKDSKEYAEMKKKIEFLHREKDDLHRQIESATALSGLAVKIDNFLKTELSPIRYSRALERLDSEVALKNLTDIIQSVEHWCEDLRRYIPQNNRKVVIDYDPAG